MHSSTEQLSHLRERSGRGNGKTVGARGPGLSRCESVSLRSVRGHTHQASPTWLPNHEPTKINSSRHVKLDVGNP